jgi:uncharacterized membrane protein
MKSQSSLSKQNIYKCILAALAGFLFALLFKILLKLIFLAIMGCLALGTIASWQRNKYSKIIKRVSFIKSIKNHHQINYQF